MRQNRKIVITALTALALLVTLALFCWRQNNALTVSRYEYTSDKVGRELDGFTIVHLSDLHNHTFGAGQAKLLEEVAGLEPDLIVITGDLVDRRRTDLDPALALARGLTELAQVYYVTGNHEWSISPLDRQTLLEGLEEAGVTVLDDRAVRMQEGFWLIGLSNQSLRDSTLTGLMEGCGDGALTVLLAHQPQYLERYAAAGVDLAFAGHAHGGQIRLPLIGGLYAPGQGFFPQLTQGLHTSGGTTLVISRGMGNSAFPLRLFNRPEIVALTLRADS